MLTCLHAYMSTNLNAYIITCLNAFMLTCLHADMLIEIILHTVSKFDPTFSFTFKILHLWLANWKKYLKNYLPTVKDQNVNQFYCYCLSWNTVEYFGFYAIILIYCYCCSSVNLEYAINFGSNNLLSKRFYVLCTFKMNY